jgi:hypothetical protein
MARTYKRDGIGRFAGGGGSSGGGGGKRPAAKSVSRGVNRLTRDNAGKITSVGGEGATARGGRLKTAAGNKRAMQTAKVSGGRPAGTMKGKVKRDPGAAGKVGQQAKPASRKEQLAAGANKRNAQADRIDARVKKLEGEYRGKDAAFYTQGAKPAGRDRMIAKSQQAAQLREQSAALRSKAANAEKMASKIKYKPVKSSGGDARLERAIKNEAAGSTSYRRNPKGYQKRIAALEAQKIYKTGDALSTVTIAQMSGKGFRLPRDKRTTPKPTNAARPKVNLSTSAFEKRAKDAGARASSARNAAKGLDQSNPSNRKAFAKANALQMASDRYSSVLRKSKNSEFTTAEVFKGINRRYSTAPKLSPSEKASRTKAANKAKTLEKNIKAQEQARRYGR